MTSHDNIIFYNIANEDAWQLFMLPNICRDLQIEKTTIM